MKSAQEKLIDEGSSTCSFRFSTSSKVLEFQIRMCSPLHATRSFPSTESPYLSYYIALPYRGQRLSTTQCAIF